MSGVELCPVVSGLPDAAEAAGQFDWT